MTLSLGVCCVYKLSVVTNFAFCNSYYNIWCNVCYRKCVPIDGGISMVGTFWDIPACSVHPLENFLQHATLFCKAILYIHCAIVCVRIMSDKSNINFTITTQVSTKTNTTTNNKGFSVSADFGHDVRVFD